MKKIWIICAIFFTFFLAACSNSEIDGTYENAKTRLTFNPKSGTVIAEGIGSYKYTNEMSYTLKDNKIVIHSGGKGDRTLSITENGSLITSGEEPFVKVTK